ncbi:hypothetical protein FH5T_07635 [Draconibacterium orientale]|jgi:hypothetical protein|uniref:Uncharacterized protein n=1 Tax=Draconibacterium orientale TaxID=1168034 RepID=A0ABM5QED6_9BACT|nr:hypothetical protein FH5T_07635 [Draconibacterium orientale]
MILAGLLACPVSEAFPSVNWRTVAKDFQKHIYGLTAAGTAPDFNRIPFSYRIALLHDKPIIQNKFSVFMYTM